ncbi:spore germination protein (amino acid permease) [Aneurinibacillus soli]|uniref:Spore germination protein YndE n=1 Tax=Aneurinibacillus soli TaxID=1500254 RepID=A0A0U5B9W1_9BACL|nr:endospore germination permease [Aneurinibacillus soli]PYE61752.1 spore germination protein (amino acid permease) [Aneurinibacillus soli]BAU28390.1 Spore germination protein YndE [Aneurinibacillus soli]
MQKEIISNRQFMALFAVVSFATTILYVPQVVTSMVDRDGWFLILISGIFGTINMMLFVILEKLYPGKNLLQVNRLVLGRFVGGIVNFAFIFYFIDLCTWTMREFADFFLITIEPTTPISVYLIVAIVLSAHIVFHGVEVLARVNEVAFFLIFFAYLLLCLLLVNQYHLEYLRPVLENGVWKPFTYWEMPTSFFGDAFVVCMFFNYVRKTKHTPMYVLAGMLLSTILLCTVVFVSIMTLGAKTSSMFTYPTLTLIRNINIAKLLDRIDIFVVTIWMLGAFIKFSSYFMASVYGLSEVLRIKKRGWIILPVALCMLVHAKFKVSSLVQLVNVYNDAPWYFQTFQLYLPSAVLVVAILVRKLGGKPL